MPSPSHLVTDAERADCRCAAHQWDDQYARRVSLCHAFVGSVRHDNDLPLGDRACRSLLACLETPETFYTHRATTHHGKLFNLTRGRAEPIESRGGASRESQNAPDDALSKQFRVQRLGDEVAELHEELGCGTAPLALGEQPRGMDCKGCLVGQTLYELDFCSRECSPGVVARRDDGDWIALHAERDCHHSSVIGRF